MFNSAIRGISDTEVNRRSNRRITERIYFGFIGLRQTFVPQNTHQFEIIFKMGSIEQKSLEGNKSTKILKAAEEGGYGVLGIVTVS